MSATNEHLTEAQAWRAIAKWISERAEPWKEAGCLCWMVDDMEAGTRLVANDTADTMRKRVGEHIAVRHRLNNSDTRAWAYAPYRDPNARCLAALWLALEAEAEATP